jgi:hypothetical protein
MAFKLFQPFIDLFSNIFGGGEKKDEPAPVDVNAIIAQRDAETKAAEEKQRTQVADQVGRGRLVNPFSGALGVGTQLDKPFKTLF